MNSDPIPPIRRSITVSWDQETAFRKFTADFASWWPRRTHSIGGEYLEQIVFEQREGGRIYEEHRDGRRFQWGEVVVWEPPRRVKFLWHPSRDPSTAQEVELEFVREADGTTLSSCHRVGSVGEREHVALAGDTTLVGVTFWMSGLAVAR
jgi:hypothetical protein